MSRFSAGSVHVVVAGWGPPHANHKRSLLWQNLKLLDSTRGRYKLKLTIFCYDSNTPLFVDRCVPKHIPTTVSYQAGIVGDFIFRFLPPAYFEGDDFVLFIMDDVELDPKTYHLARAIEVLRAAQLDILSPAMTEQSKLTSGSKAYWKQRVLPSSKNRGGLEEKKVNDADDYPAEVVRHMHQLEFYTYLMSIHSYEVYYSLFKPETHWMYGLDLILHEEGLRPGIWDNAFFTHHYVGGSDAATNTINPWHEFQLLQTRRGNKPFDWGRTTIDITEHHFDNRHGLHSSLADITATLWNHCVLSTKPTPSRVAVFWLCVELSEVHKKILVAVKQACPWLDVFYVTDKEQEFTMEMDRRLPATVTRLAISDKACLETGYCKTIGSMTKAGSVSAWDKALYFAAEHLRQYDHVWFLEDDVLVPSIQAFQNVLNKYSIPENDLISAEDEENATGRTDSWWWFRLPPTKIPPPWYRSMVSSCGMSRRLLNEIRKRQENCGELFFNEAMMGTLAHKAHLKVVIAPELSTIVWRFNDCDHGRIYPNVAVDKYDWPQEEVDRRPDHFFHPVKAPHRHNQTLAPAGSRPCASAEREEVAGSKSRRPPVQPVLKPPDVVTRHGSCVVTDYA